MRSAQQPPAHSSTSPQSQRDEEMQHGCGEALQSGEVDVYLLPHECPLPMSRHCRYLRCVPDQRSWALLHWMLVRPISAVSGASLRRKLLPPGFWDGLRRRSRGVTPGLRRLPRGLATGLRRPSALALSGLMRGVDMFSMSCSASTDVAIRISAFKSSQLLSRMSHCQNTCS